MMKTSSALRGLRVDIDLRKIGERTSTVPGTFRKTVEFAVPTPSTAGETALNKYLSKLEALRGVLSKEEDTRGPNLDPAPRLATASTTPSSRRRTCSRASTTRPRRS